MSTPELDWGPDACTLPTAERPLRLAEFDALLAESLRWQDRPAPTRLRWHLQPEAEPAARGLTQREAACCSFFTFSFTPAKADLVVDVEVPAEYIAVLDALQTQAAARMKP